MTAASHQQSFFANPLLPLATAFAAGIVLVRFVPCRLTLLVPLAALLTLLSLISFLLRRLNFGVIALTLTLLSLGGCFFVVEKEMRSPNSLSRLLDSGQVPMGEPVLVTGLVVGAVEYAPDALHFDLGVERVFNNGSERVTNGLVTVTLPFSDKPAATEVTLSELHHGALVRVTMELDRRDKFRNPGGSRLVDFLGSKGYEAIGLVRSPQLIERLDHRRSSISLASIYDWRGKLEDKITATFSLDTAGVLNAALVGNRYGLSRQTSEKFREGGTFHVLVISGLHISFIGGVMFTLARRLTKKRVLQFLLSTSFLWSYTLAVGANASVVRAAFMFSFVTFAPIVARRAASLNALAAAGLLLLVWHPSELFNPSYQLTFLSVFAIIALAWPLLMRFSSIGTWRPTHDNPCPPITRESLRQLAELLYWSEKRWRKELERSTHSYRLFKMPLAAKLERWHLQRPLRYAFAAMVVSGSVQFTLLPLLVVLFHRISVAALVLNIGVSVLMMLLTVSALMALLVKSVSGALAMPFVEIANALNWLMVNSVLPFAHLRIASLRVPEYSGKAAAIYVLYFVPLLLLAIRLAQWRPIFDSKRPTNNCRPRMLKLMIVAQVLLVALVVLHPFSKRVTDGKLRLDFLDVGQGDSALVTTPDGSTMLIDGGGRPVFKQPEVTAGETFEPDRRSIGDAVVSEFLWTEGLDGIDYILPTHADADHIDGLSDVVKNFRVRAALVGRMPEADPEFDLFLATSREHAVPLITLSAGDTLQFRDVFIDVLWPTGDANGRSQNNDSVVLRIGLGERSILMTGDIETRAETALVRTGSQLRADVVKVAHHGSKTSSTQGFVNATSTRFALISVGRKSMFGHPNADVLERWRASGAEVLTTGKCGTITVETDGNRLEVSTFVHDSDCRVARH